MQDAVVALILDIENNEFGLGLELTDQPDLVDVASSYQDAGGQFWVAVDSDEVVGTIAMFNLTNSNADLRKMFVKECYRGGNPSAAQLLLEESLSWARRSGYGRVYLETSSQFAAAIRFYKRNGFEEIETSALPAGFPVIRVAEHFYAMDLVRT